MKKAIAAVVAVAIVIAGYFAFSAHEQQKFLESIRPHVKNSSLRLANAIRYETEEGTKITFKELFEKLEADVAEIDKRILDVQTIATPSNKEVTDPVLDYMKSSQELLRALLMKYRKRLAFSNAIDWTERAIDEMKTTSYYGMEYAKRTGDKAIKDLEKAQVEYKGAIADVIGATNNMRETYSKVVASLPRDVLIDPAILEAVSKKNAPNAKEEDSKIGAKNP